MKKLFLTVCSVALATLAIAAPPIVNKPSYNIASFNDSASYAIGKDMYRAWSSQNLGINVEAVAAALLDSKNGSAVLDEETERGLLMRFQQEFERRQYAAVQENIDKGKAFLAENKTKPGVKETESGLQYKVVKSGNGVRPQVTDVVKVHYTGTLIDGTKFDSSVDRGEPIEFPLNQVIPGWSEGVQLMDVGATYMLYIPYHLAYGEQQTGMIPAGSTIIFEVQLLDINPDKKEGEQK